MRPQDGQASCCGRAALLLLLLLAVTASLARPSAAASIISTVCPTGNSIVNVPANSDLAEVFYTAGNGAGKTYVLQRGLRYTLSSQIAVTGFQATASTTCFIGGGDKRGDVVITATAGIPSNTAAFSWPGYATSRAATTFGMKGLTLNNGVNAAGFEFVGDTVGWSIQDVTVRGGTGGLFTSQTSKGDLDDVAFEYIEGSGLDGAPLLITKLISGAPYQWRDLVVTDCTNPIDSAVMSLSLDTSISFSGRVYMARNRAGAASPGGALYALEFTGDVTFEDNQATYGGAAYIDASSFVRFAESSTLLVKGNQASYGGGFYIAGSTVLMLGTTRFIGNTADQVAGGQGGAVYAGDLNGPSQVVFNAVCISGNTASEGSGIYLDVDATATFNLPALAQMSDNRPAASSISVTTGSSWTCSGSDPARTEGLYDITGPICACQDDIKTCSCPDTCACGVCEPGSGPCCKELGQLAPCTRSIKLNTYAQGSPKHYSSRQHSAKHSGSAVSVELVATVWDTASGAAQGPSAPAVNVPVSFAVHGDCAPDVAARSSITDAQGRAHARVTFSRPPGNVAVVAAVRSAGSLPSRVVKAVRHLKHAPHDAPGYGTPEDDDEEPGRSSYERDGYDDRTQHTHRYGAGHEDAEAFEAVATQMVLQALQEGEEAAEVAASGGARV